MNILSDNNDIVYEIKIIQKNILYVKIVNYFSGYLGRCTDSILKLLMENVGLGGEYHLIYDARNLSTTNLLTDEDFRQSDKQRTKTYTDYNRLSTIMIVSDLELNSKITYSYMVEKMIICGYKIEPHFVNTYEEALAIVRNKESMLSNYK